MPGIGNKIDEGYESGRGAYQQTAGDLQAAENEGSGYTDSGVDQAEAYANDPKNASKSTEDVAAREENPSGGWHTNFDSFVDSKGFTKTPNKFNVKSLVKKGGPAGGVVGIIIALIFGLGGLGMGLMPTHIKELFENRMNTMIPTQDARSRSLIVMKMFGGTDNATKRCAGGIKVYCTYSTMSKSQIETLNADGYYLLGKDGSPIKPDENGRYKGGKLLAKKDGGSYTQKISSKEFAVKINLDSNLRSTMTKVYPSRYSTVRDKLGSTFYATKRLILNPKWSDDIDPNSPDGKKKVARNLSDSMADPNVADGDLGDYSDSVNEGVAEVGDNIDNGKPNIMPNDPGEILSSPAVDKSGGLLSSVFGAAKSVTGANVALGMCASHMYAQRIYTLSKTVARAQAMIWATQFLSTADKLKDGSASPSEVEALGNIIQKQDQYGDAGGDSVGYHYLAYNAPTNRASTDIGSGTAVLAAISTYLLMMNRFSGGHGQAVTAACGAVTSFLGQILVTSFGIVAQAAIAFFTAGTGTLAFEAGASASRLAVKEAIDQITKKVTENITKDAVKSLAKRAGKQLAKEAGGITGGLFIGYLMERYFTAYIVHLATGTMISPDSNGVTAIDNLTYGGGAMIGGIAQQRALLPMTKSQALAYSNYQSAATARYIADKRKETSMFDASTPYSPLGSIAVSFVQYRNDLLSGLRDTSTIPRTIANYSNPLTLFSSTAYAETLDQRQELYNECSDPDLVDKNIALDPFCNPIYGFNDLNMLENTTSEQVLDYMIDNHQIDNDGQPIAESEYAAFRAKCIDGTENKVISTLVESANQLDKDCYDESKNATTQIKMFRLYIMDNNISDGMENGMPDPTSVSPSASGVTSATPGTFDVVAPCPAGTKDLDTIKSKYTGDLASNKTPEIRLCQLSSISGSGDNGDKGLISGGAVLNAVAAGPFQKLGEEAQKAGINLNASSSFRYADSCGGTGDGTLCAAPGSSMHQLGIAIDFSLTDGHTGPSTTDCSLRATSTDPAWLWLKANAPAIGIKQYTYENWHWDISGMANRCG